ncbi:MAG: signal peptidase I [Clostridia bacterium]|nr:signal peptidase I [Clostridia bacterium]
MSRDRKILYTSSIALVLVLLGALFLPGNIGRVSTALLLAVSAVIVFFLVKKRPILSINKNTVLLIMIAMGAVCLVLYYLTGVHFGFYKSSTPLSMGSFLKNILPIATIIIAIEFIRCVLLAQNAKGIGVLAYAAGVLSEFLLFSTLGSITTFNRFMDVMGLYLLPAVTANLLYQFLSKRYGFWPGASYRLLMSLYLYVFPVYPRTPDIIFSFAKMLFPLLIYVFLQLLYAGAKRYEKPKSRAASLVGMGLSALFMISIVLLISGEFRYRMLIIATESMTGDLNKGDAAVYEEYDGQHISEQDVVVFIKNDSRIVHRVVYIECINGVNRYYTKGDANDERDTGYITDAAIEGVVLFKIPYFGHFTLWMRDLFKR